MAASKNPTEILSNTLHRLRLAAVTSFPTTSTMHSMSAVTQHTLMSDCDDDDEDDAMNLSLQHDGSESTMDDRDCYGHAKQHNTSRSTCSTVPSHASQSNDSCAQFNASRDDDDDDDDDSINDSDLESDDGIYGRQGKDFISPSIRRMCIQNGLEQLDDDFHVDNDVEIAITIPPTSSKPKRQFQPPKSRLTQKNAKRMIGLLWGNRSKSAHRINAPQDDSDDIIVDTAHHSASSLDHHVFAKNNNEKKDIPPRRPRSCSPSRWVAGSNDHNETTSSRTYRGSSSSGRNAKSQHSRKSAPSRAQGGQPREDKSRTLVGSTNSKRLRRRSRSKDGSRKGTARSLSPSKNRRRSRSRQGRSVRAQRTVNRATDAASDVDQFRLRRQKSGEVRRRVKSGRSALVRRRSGDIVAPQKSASSVRRKRRSISCSEVDGVTTATKPTTDGRNAEEETDRSQVFIQGMGKVTMEYQSRSEDDIKGNGDGGIDDDNNDNDNDRSKPFDDASTVSFYEEEFEEDDVPKRDDESHEAALRRLINEERKDRGLGPLTQVDALCDRALDHVIREVTNTGRGRRTAKNPGILLKGSSPGAIFDQLAEDGDESMAFNPFFHECGIAVTEKNDSIFICILFGGGFELKCMYDGTGGGDG
eukprot:CAMPEP_0119570466 /NCGR_PEP_ID=MMETSP1352-20130426/43625_1 /TAXON_ID=265584 /ORGANISM="Stauroneis constricta, Strain CCMP1120" /LENGTH=642 /DNA_ID=CAMNT_0007620135 /DNA_START=117 /DNA_END=2046 /DNA_ORIENTATION=+